MTDRALDIGEIRLTLAPISLKSGIWLNTFPKSKNNGDPGGWGTPRMYDVAINSPQSQKEVVGAIVKKYKTNGNTKANNPNILLIWLYINYPILINSSICL